MRSGGAQPVLAATRCSPAPLVAKPIALRAQLQPTRRISTWGRVVQNRKTSRSVKNLLHFFRGCT